MARRKDAKIKQAKRRKENRAEEKSGRELFLEKVQNLMNIQKEKIAPSANGSEKMSEVILDFAEPLLLLSDDEEFGRKAIRVAILIWNISLLPKEKQEKALQEIYADFSRPDDPDYLAGIKTMINVLMERKRTHFPDNKRTIKDYQISGSGKNYRLDIVSTPSP